MVRYYDDEVKSPRQGGQQLIAYLTLRPTGTECASLASRTGSLSCVACVPSSPAISTHDKLFAECKISQHFCQICLVAPLAKPLSALASKGVSSAKPG